MFKKSCVLFLMIFQFGDVFGGIGSDLEGFFHKMGSSTNVTTSGAFQDQAGGYYSGGGIAIRNRSKNVQLMNLQLPKLNAGCGGINLFNGGFSFISSKELVSTLKAIGANAVTYGFKLAMQTMAPSVNNTITDLFNKALEITRSNINSCETATTLVGGLWPKGEIASRHVCTSLGTASGALKDWAAARHDCGAGQQSNSILGGKNGKEEYKNILVNEFNVAWEVLGKNSYLFNDKEFAELCMTISGTIVAYKDANGERRVKTFPSKADQADLIKGLFDGGEVDVYKCEDGEKCLKVGSKRVRIASSGLANQVRKTLHEITNKAIQDEELTQQEKDFIEGVKLPLFKFINVLAAYKHSGLTLTEYTDIVSIDLIHHYITEIIDVMLAEAANLRNVQVSDEEITTFIKQLRQAKASIHNKRMAAYEEMTKTLMLIENTTIYERKLEDSFERMQRSN